MRYNEQYNLFQQSEYIYQPSTDETIIVIMERLFKDNKGIYVFDVKPNEIVFVVKDSREKDFFVSIIRNKEQGLDIAISKKGLNETPKTHNEMINGKTG